MNAKYTVILVLFTLVTLAGEWFVGVHPRFGFEHMGFYLWFGFVSSAVLIVAALIIGKIIKRGDHYYDD